MLRRRVRFIVVRMATEATEPAEVARHDVAGRTTAPAAPVPARVDREEHRVVIEASLLPDAGRVTGIAAGGKPRGNMIGIGRGEIVVQVARHACGRDLAELERP